MIGRWQDNDKETASDVGVAGEALVRAKQCSTADALARLLVASTVGVAGDALVRAMQCRTADSMAHSGFVPTLSKCECRVTQRLPVLIYYIL